MEKKRLKPVMFAGTGSDVGKSIVATAICRILKQDGFSPAPFKAQNMSLNSYATPDGFEIGRAQAVQAEACRIACSTDMNPILLKPNSDHTSQIILNGKPIGNKSVRQYFSKEMRENLRREVNQSFLRLSSSYNPIVMEGAGSISEMNLQDIDLVNMPMARDAGADVILVADIDRGGVFASVYGSIMLQTPNDKKRIKGIIINKFRGDIELFKPGIKIIEDLCAVPVLGVLPYFDDIDIEEEDSVALKNKKRTSVSNKINIAVILLKHLSNFTDFDVIERDDRVNLFYTANPEDLENADIIILPGSKSTIDDIYELRKSGLARSIVKAYESGKSVLGICGGYQMLGHMVYDPYSVEGGVSSIPGLSLLPIETSITKEKKTSQKIFSLLDDSEKLKGYEIHMGETKTVDAGVESRPLVKFEDGMSDGCYVNDRLMGTYMHGILDNKTFIDRLLSPFDKSVYEDEDCIKDYDSYKNEQYDKLAAHVRKYIDIDSLYKIMSYDD